MRLCCRAVASWGGFTLVEAVVAMTITAIAASSLLLGVHSAMMTSAHVEEQTIALGIAQQLLDELLGPCYGSLDNYDGFRAPVPTRLRGTHETRHSGFGLPTGFFENWSEEIEVKRDDDCRRITVRILLAEPDGVKRPLAELHWVDYGLASG